MHENKFEKQVQEKMEELQFAPSEAVWENVDKKINKNEKRRRPVFWLFFLTGLVFLGVGFLFSVNKNSTYIHTNVRQQKQMGNPQDEQSVNKNEKVITDKKNENDDTKKSDKEITKDGTKENKVPSDNPFENQKQQRALSQFSQNSRRTLNRKRRGTSLASESGKEKNYINEPMIFDKQMNNLPEHFSNSKKSSETIVENNLPSADKIELNPDKSNAFDSSVNKKKIDITKSASQKNDSASDVNTAQNKKQQKKVSAWQIGFTGGVGISNINQSLFKSTYVTNLSSYNPATSVTSTGSTTINSPSKISPGFSFTAGFFVSKHLSKRVSFSGGISYQYYSTKIKVGHSVDSIIYVYSYGASTPAAQTGGYYHNGSSNEYSNFYHFIELPLTLNFQLNKSLKLPVVWESGFSTSYLVGSNALHFDPVTNVYYKNNSLFNKLQINATTAMMVDFHIQKSELQLGPQLEYGLTHILNKNTGNPEHLFYTGLKVSFIPRKK